MSDQLKACMNTDREIWRENQYDYYSPSIHVTGGGGIGMNVGGRVIVMPVRKWHELAMANFRSASQNQTVSSGVEGAHEGTTADKSGSREPEKSWCPECCTESGKTEYGDCTNSFHNEPEKLNNAQIVSERSKVELLAGDIWDSNARLLPDYNGAVELAEWLRRNYSVVALAESSLSSMRYFFNDKEMSREEYLAAKEETRRKMGLSSSPELLPTQLPKDE